VANGFIEYSKLLKEKELKSTPQRLAMLKILEDRGHVDIDSIYKEIKNDFESISLATVYKNINKMLDVGLIEEIKVPKRKSKFEIKKQRHSHFVCERCAEIYDIEAPQKLEVKLPKGFKPKESSVLIVGVCISCA
jgi:Fur family peroxide stress response transcriptional regulator